MEEGSEYGYRTVIEMWIPQSAIDNNPTPNKVQFTRAALFHKNLESDPETWLVLRSAWDGAGMHNCYITKHGIVDTYLLAGLDGVIEAEEYAGNVMVSNAAGQVPEDQYYVEVRGKLVQNKNMKLAIKIDSNIDPNSAVKADVPEAVIDEDAPTGDFVCIPRVYIYADQLTDGVGKPRDKSLLFKRVYGSIKETFEENVNVGGFYRYGKLQAGIY